MKNLLVLVSAFFAKLLGKIKKVDLEWADEAIAIANFVKSILGNEITAELLKKYAAGWGAGVADNIIVKLDAILPYLHTIDEANHLSPEDRVAYIINKIKELPHDGQNKNLLGIASRYLRTRFPDLTELKADSIIQGLLLQKKSA